MSALWTMLRSGTPVQVSWPNPTLNAIDVMARGRYPISAVNQGGLAFRWSSPQRSFACVINTTGTLGLYLSSTGSDSFSAASTAAIGSPGDVVSGWFRWTWQDSDNALKFYTAPNVPDPTGLWAQVGATTSLAMAGPIYTGGSNVCYVHGTSGLFPVDWGEMKRLIVKDGYDGAGSTVYDVNFSKQLPGTTVFTEDSVNAATVTVNGSTVPPQAGIVGRVSV